MAVSRVALFGAAVLFAAVVFALQTGCTRGEQQASAEVAAPAQPDLAAVRPATERLTKA